MQALSGDRSADAYLVRLIKRAEQLAAAAFVGGYLLNSGARRDYLPGRSDLDVAVIVADALHPVEKHRLAGALRHGAIPCPAPRLELVVYRREVAIAPGGAPAFELNLNTGPAIADHVTVDPADEPPHWFVLDLAAAFDAARAVTGPDPRTVFGEMPRRAVLDALTASIEWHRANEPGAPNRVLNACRTWCWLETSRWSSKSMAGAWAIDAGGDEELIRHALARRTGERDDLLPVERVEALASAVRIMVDEASRLSPA